MSGECSLVGRLCETKGVTVAALGFCDGHTLVPCLAIASRKILLSHGGRGLRRTSKGILGELPGHGAHDRKSGGGGKDDRRQEDKQATRHYNHSNTFDDD